MLILRYLTQVEQEIRALIAYAFDYFNDNGKIPWYDINAYNPQEETKNIIQLISKLYQEVDRSRQEYVRFYLDNHKIIPTWILLKICNFSSLITFLERSKTEVIDSLCNLYGFIDTTIPASYKRRHLVGSLQLIRIIRNSAAHNEAIFSFPNRSSRIIDSYVDRMPNSYKKPSNKNIFDLCVALKYYLDDESYTNFSNQLFSLLNDLKATINPIAFDRVRASIGFKHLDHIRTLESLSRIKPLIFKEFPKI